MVDRWCLHSFSLCRDCALTIFCLQVDRLPLLNHQAASPSISAHNPAVTSFTRAPKIQKNINRRRQPLRVHVANNPAHSLTAVSVKHSDHMRLYASRWPVIRKRWKKSHEERQTWSGPWAWATLLMTKAWISCNLHKPFQKLIEYGGFQAQTNSRKAEMMSLWLLWSDTEEAGIAS